ncbi:Glyoxalase/bleomycin resistance protein/dioxygenase [Gloeocapsa sp. PCC 7428]|uniref:VOC family protein n=1 Tax=Gloeocapsa sp. PCC 7428 TaxID=1173026 RepID=UPI0002A5BD1B|nr:VOC family protein [Gloeocapsa sp. PCC 7428]AFZ28796.1 Glyoxalase/bleomycin resistance protein/dioxygenase [Gloeocapsa sp. PCC 7428]
MQITQCLHAALLVTDLQRAEDFYSNILGLSKSTARNLNFPGTWYQIGDFQLHLIVAPTVPPQIQNPEKWGRNPHISFAVTDLNAIKQHLITHNYPIQSSASGRSALFTKDPDNNIIELSQI